MPQQWWRSIATIPRATNTPIKADAAHTAVFKVKYDYYKDYDLKLRTYRRKHKLTQKQLGELLRVTYPTIRQWETGRTKPSYLYWQRIKELIEKPPS